MKRLITAQDAGSLAGENISVDISSATDMIKLKELEAIDVKNNKCPKCRYSPLAKQNDVLICQDCGAAYKILSDNTYMLV